MPASAPASNASLLVSEFGLTAIAFVAAFAWPRVGSTWFRGIERRFAALARRKGLAIVTVGVSTVLLRVALLPIFPIPAPFVTDDFSFLLSGDTFAQGRLTNPTPAMWTHFESIHIDMNPTYGSMYFPGQGLILAAGKVLFGNPWFGLLCVDGLMCAAICWMLQAWLPPNWALLGGILAVLRLGLFSYWINTYLACALPALGGALVLGALPHLMKNARVRYSLLMAVGIAILVLTRPYEGLLLCLPVTIALGHWALFGKNRPNLRTVVRRIALPLALVVASVAWLGYYDYRAFGSPLVLPYTVNRSTYAMAPYFVWQTQRPEPVYRHAELRRFYQSRELVFFTEIHSWARFIPITLKKVGFIFLFYSCFALLPPLIMLRRVLLDRRTRFLILCTVVLAAGMLIEIFSIPHYVAPFVAAFYAIGLQAMRHLRVWHPEGKPVGITMVRLIVTACFLMALLRISARPLGMAISEWPATNWSSTWFGPQHFGLERAQIEAQMEKFPGGQLAIVRYAPGHEPLDEWVYNSANIDSSKVIWSREMDSKSNLELLHFYPERKVWLVEPDTSPPSVTAFVTPEQTNTASTQSIPR
jgi:hypothetical protein